jgi:dienelactone hydrolase
LRQLGIGVAAMMRHLRRRAGYLLAPPLLFALAVSIGQVRRSTGSGSRVETHSLASSDGSRVYAELHLPNGDGGHDRTRPAVVLSHGYLANSGFMRSAWVGDLTRRGWVTLLIDRRGHGRSDGAWWPPGQGGDGAPTHPDLDAAVAFLRDDARVDPARIALVGHSDGATAALITASADWDIAATVAASASVAPWELVNHVAPRSLLLIFGEEDSFVLGDTDALLISAATRGYLGGAGQVGQPADGSGRKLVRIDGAGHLDVSFSERARGEALAWLAAAFGEPSDQPPAGIGAHAEAVGATSLLLLLATLPLAGAGCPRRRPAAGLSGALLLAVIGCAWVGGLRAASWLGAAQPLPLPTQELPGASWVFVLLALCGGLAGGLATVASSESRTPRARERYRVARQILAGAALGAIVQVVVELLASRFHDSPWTMQRTWLLAIAAALAMPAFLTLEWGCARLGRVAPLPRWLPLEVPLAATMVLAGWAWFPRMSAVPVHLLAAALLLTGALRVGSPAATPWLTGSFAGVIAARLTSNVVAFH